MGKGNKRAERVINKQGDATFRQVGCNAGFKKIQRLAFSYARIKDFFVGVSRYDSLLLKKSRVYLRKSQGMLFFGAFLVSVHDIIREITTVFISPRLVRGTRELLH